jgi:hypothetical protein
MYIPLLGINSLRSEKVINEVLYKFVLSYTKSSANLFWLEGVLMCTQFFKKRTLTFSFLGGEYFCVFLVKIKNGIRTTKGT